MTTMNISLPENLKGFVDSQVQEGGYSTSSEYIRELIREDQKKKLEQLEGMQSGEPGCRRCRLLECETAAAERGGS